MSLRALLLFLLIPTSLAMASDGPRFRIPTLSSLVNRFERPLIASSLSTAVIEEPERLVAIGDVHGDFDALVKILREMKLIDRHKNWVGGATVLIQMGDFLAQGTQSRQVMDLLMKLEIQAEHSGGRAITLLGNHESYVMRGEFEMLTAQDGRSFLELIDHRGNVTDQTLKEAIAFAMSENSPYGQWVVERPTVVKVGRKLFVHAGVEKWIEKLDYNRLNATVRAWMLHFQNSDRNKRPPSGTEWVFGPHGPLQTRRLGKGATDPQEYFRWLAGANLDAVVVGHTKVRDLTQVTENAKYGNKLIMIDTGISWAKGGVPTAVEFIRGESPRSHIVNRQGLCRQKHL